jgi:hypothetical protein
MERSRGKLKLIAAIASGAICLLVPSGASAVVSCSFDAGTHTVTATATADADRLGLVAIPGATPAIATDPDPDDPFGDSPAPVACGAATVENTETVVINDNSPGDAARLSIDMRGGRFAPGFTDEGLFNADEIEFRLNVGGGGDNWLTIWGTESDDGISAGTDGITLNAQSEQLINIKDIDVTNAAGTAFPDIGNGTLFRVNTSGGDDWIKADGSDSTGSAIDDYDGIFSGGSGDDVLFGTDGARNVLNHGPGDDLVDGKGAASNVLIMGQTNPVGVTVDLSITTPQITGAGTDTYLNIDDMQGTDLADVLKGTNGDNQIDGLAGADVIRGAGGDDELNGSLENADPPRQGDTLAYDGTAVLTGQDVDLGTLTSSGGQGTDAITGFDNVIGTAFADTLAGDDFGNQITGGTGIDEIRGDEGPDDLRSEDGGIVDSVDCGQDTDVDRVTPDLGPAPAYPSLDTLLNCGAADVINRPPPVPAPPAALAKCKKAKKKKGKKRAAEAKKKKKKKKKCKKKKPRKRR